MSDSDSDTRRIRIIIAAESVLQDERIFPKLQSNLIFDNHQIVDFLSSLVFYNHGTAQGPSLQSVGGAAPEFFSLRHNFLAISRV